MEFTEDFIEKNQLTEEQVSAISEHVQTYVNTELGTKVHENTEKNLGKIWDTVKEATGIEREQGEKYADAIKRASELHFEGTRKQLARQKQELEEKIKNTGGNDVLKQELENTKAAMQDLKQKAAKYDEWEKNNYKGKYEETIQKLNATERKIAFNSVTPPKPENVNEYEWKAKWREWENEVTDKHNIVFDENGTAWAIDKDNEYTKYKLSDLAKQNDTLQEMLKQRAQKGLGATPKKMAIEGVPFDVPENATPQERQKLIKEYLASQSIDTTDKRYAKMFSDLNSKILGLGKKQA